MGIPIKKLSYYDLEFYKQYQDWYYHEWSPKNTPIKEITHSFKIGDIVYIKHSITPGYENQTGIIMSYAGMNRYYYVMAYARERYWACGFPESDLKKLDVNMVDDEKLYDAFNDWIIRNDFNLCTKEFEESYYKYMKDKSNVFKRVDKKDNIIYVKF
jgi:hypothetical protein